MATAWLGGIAITAGYGYASTGWVGAILAVAGLGVSPSRWRASGRRALSPDRPTRRSVTRMGPVRTMTAGSRGCPGTALRADHERVESVFVELPPGQHIGPVGDDRILRLLEVRVLGGEFAVDLVRRLQGRIHDGGRERALVPRRPRPCGGAPGRSPRRTSRASRNWRPPKPGTGWPGRLSAARSHFCWLTTRCSMAPPSHHPGA